MYRVVGILAQERGIGLDDDAALGTLSGALRFTPGADRLLVDGRDLSDAIRRADAGELASRISARPVVRAALVAVQRAIAAAGDVVMEGRDIGTVVCPDAPVKFFLTAEPPERARRRALELRSRGEAVDEAALAADLAVRDARDSGRSTAPLRAADDAIVMDTTGRTLGEVIAEMERVVRRRLGIGNP
jgi:cytidylate kinase